MSGQSHIRPDGEGRGDETPVLARDDAPTGPPAAVAAAGMGTAATATMAAVAGDAADDADADKADKSCDECGSKNRSDTKFCRACGAPLGPDPLVGRTIEDRYEVVRRLGAGAMGAVYEVKHKRLAGKRFAMKTVRRALGQQPEFAHRFEQEALSCSRLEHPNCIAVTDFGKAADGPLYLVMEFLQGRELADEMGERWAIGRALNVVRQVLLGLEHAHAAGVVHRDIKPANVMLLAGSKAHEERVKVVDFGIASLPTQGERGSSSEQSESAEEKKKKKRLTTAGLVIGTPEYMAPEQALGTASVDARADLYAVGVILWELLVGRPPIVADNAIELLEHKLAQDAPRLARVCPGVFAPEIEQLLARALVRNPSKRIKSAREMIDIIEAVQRQPGGGLFVGRPPGPLARVGGLYADWYYDNLSWSARAKALVTSAAGAMVLGSALAVVLAPVLILSLLLGGASKTTGAPGSGAGSGAAVAGSGSGSASGSGATAGSGSAHLRPSASSALDKPTERRLIAARKLLDRYACHAARKSLSAIIAKRPNLAFAHYLMGAAEICSGKHAEGLRSYAKALSLEHDLVQDKRMMRDVTGLLASRHRKSRLAALLFIQKHLGKAGAPLILKAAVNHTRSVRHAAVVAATRMGIDSKIDWVRSLELDLHQLPCRDLKRRRIVERLAERGSDPRVRKILEHAKRARAGFLGYRRRYGCVLGRIKKALRELEAR